MEPLSLSSAVPLPLYSAKSCRNWSNR